MKPQILQVEKEKTASQLLKEEYGLDSKNYFLSVNGEMATARTKVLPTDKVEAIPIVKGG